MTLTLQVTKTISSATASSGGGGTDTFINYLTIEDASASSKTNVPFSIGIPLAPDDLPSGTNFRLYDEDGSGGLGSVLSNFQVDATSTDFNSKTRFLRVSGILPSLGLSAKRKLRYYSSSSAVPTGTAITATDLLATSFRIVVSYDMGGGTTYAFDTDDALAASETFSKTDYQCIVVYSGPCRTDFLVSGPPENSGIAHASGEGVRTYIQISAFKATTGAVNGGNPITSVVSDVWTENGDCERASPSNYYYGYRIERSTSLTDGTLIYSDDTDPDDNVIRYDYPRSVPTETLTCPGATTTGSKTGANAWTIPSGPWATDILGARITSSDGAAVVTARNSDTSVNVYVYDAFGATSYTSGNWSIEGIGQPYNATMPPRRVYVGQKPDHIVAWGDNTSAITPTTRAPMEFATRTEMLLNYQLPYASVTHSLTSLNLLKASDGSRRPFTFLGGTATNMGELRTDISGTGQTSGPNVGPIPQYSHHGLVKFDANGRRRIFENAESWGTFQFMPPRRMSGTPSAGELGVWPRADGGTTYLFRTGWETSTLIKGVIWGTGSVQPSGLGGAYWPFQSDFAHHSSAHYVPYLLTGDLFWLIMLQRQAHVAGTMARAGGTSAVASNGLGMNKTPFGDADGVNSQTMGNDQTRAKTWSFRDELLACISTPDSISEKVVNPKTYWVQRVEKNWDAVKFYGPDDVNNVRHGADSAPQWFNTANVDSSDGSHVTGSRDESGYGMSFARVVFGFAGELGLQDADGQASYLWAMKGARDLGSPTDVIVRDITTDLYNVLLFDDTYFPQASVTGWADVYRCACCLNSIRVGDIAQASWTRIPGGTVTLSDATVGSGRTMTFSENYFSGGGSWYANGFVSESIAATTGGKFKITSVSVDGLTLTGDVTGAFSGTSLAPANLVIPGPHPDDYAGEKAAINTTSYAQYFTVACRIAASQSVLTTEMDEIAAYMAGRSGFTETVAPHLYVGRR